MKTLITAVPCLALAVTSHGREPMHATYFACESQVLAGKGDSSASENYLSLDGRWVFKWVPKPADRPRGFWKQGYDDSRWDDFRVPATGEVMKRQPGPADRRFGSKSS